MWASVDAGLVRATGHGLDHWLGVARAAGLPRVGELRSHLQGAGLSYGHANSVALKALGTDASSIDEAALVEAMFAGPKSALRPIHERLVAIVSSLGPDVELATKKGYVSARRSKQFAILMPSTRDRYDLGLNLKGTEPSGRLEAAGSWNAMVSHRVRLAGVDAVDAAVEAWLREAYARA